MRTCKALSMALALAALGVCTSSPTPAFGESNPSGISIDSEVAEHFRAGQEATRAGQADRAIHEYRQVLRLRPNLIEARVNLGLDYYMAGQYQQATVELEKARQAKPDLVATNLFLGMAYQKLGFAAKAIPPLEAVLRQDSTNQEALRTLGASYLDRDNYLKATKVYLKLFATDADPVDGWYVLGQNYMAMALQLHDENLKKFPDTPWQARLNGDVLVEDQKWVDAAAQYRRALALDDKIPGLHAALGEMLLRQGKLEDAEAEYRAELHRDAKSEGALLGLAETDLAQGTVTLAIENVTKIWDVFPPFLGRRTDFPSVSIAAPKLATLAQDLATAPDSPARDFLLASIDRAAGLNEPATQEWSKFLASLKAWSATQKKAGSRTEPIGVVCATHRYAECAELLLAQKLRSPVQDVLLGRAQLALGDEQAAVVAFAEALNRDPADAQSRYWLIKSYQPLALACLNHMVELAPDSWRVHQIRGEYYQSRYDYKKAVEEFRIAVGAHPGSAELHEKLGNACLLNKTAAEGKAEIERALEIDPTRTSSLCLLGRVYFQDRDYPKSIEYFQTALRFDPRFLPAHAALGRAYMRVGKPADAVPELEKAASTDEYGDLHYLLSMAYRQLGKADLAVHALAVSQELRKQSAAHHEAGVAAAEGELADQ
jgi:tetratricopeptide (TPR) repeat protein